MSKVAIYSIATELGHYSPVSPSGLGIDQNVIDARSRRINVQVCGLQVYHESCTLVSRTGARTGSRALSLSFPIIGKRKEPRAGYLAAVNQAFGIDGAARLRFPFQ